MRIRWSVFGPVFVLMMVSVIFSLSQKEDFLRMVTGLNDWMLYHFDWLFNAATLLCLTTILGLYFSRWGQIKIGGEGARRLLPPLKYFAITLCTTIAAGILFWSASEPLYHHHSPPPFAGVEPNSIASKAFSISTMYLHWSFTPYAIYTIFSVAFALGFYSFRQSFSISAMFYPLTRRKMSSSWSSAIDVLCLTALILGMSAALGAGIFTIAGGLQVLFQMEENSTLLAIITASIVGTFVISSVSGLHKGIRFLSDVNLRLFLVILVSTAFFAFKWGALKLGWSGLVHYVANFIPSSIGHFGEEDRAWTSDWTVFYWAVWMAWAPCTAMFLGRISRGYTLRQVITYNLIYPSLFAIVWITIFSGSALALDSINTGMLYERLLQEGPQSSVYLLFAQMPFSQLISGIFLFIVFISFVTASDSNTTVIGSMSTKGISSDNQESPAILKVVWGLLIGFTSWLMISSTGVDGIRMLSTIGGFPVLFILLIVTTGMIRLILTQPRKILPKDGL
ncbi:MAG: BCCT family transporter [Saprospiraceae bacterium]|nr:BCCT family transporter [Saprospiraceae bacterium]